MPDVKHCADCGALLPSYWPKGLCAQCAIDGALEMSNAVNQVHQAETLVVTPAERKPPGSGHEGLGSFGGYDLLEEIARVCVHRLMRRSDPAPVRLRSRCVGFAERDGRVLAHFADGHEAHGDFLVGADGLVPPSGQRDLMHLLEERHLRRAAVRKGTVAGRVAGKRFWPGGRTILVDCP